MSYTISKILIFVFLLIFNFEVYGDVDKINRIEILVNEDIITNYDITQRMKINAILRRVEINDDNYKQLIDAVVDDLIVEKLKNKKISEYDISFEKDEFNKQEKRFYSSLNYKKEDLKNIFSLNNINYQYLLDYIEIELKWQKLIYGLYLRVTSVTDQEIDDLISKNPNMTKEIANDIILQKQLDIKSKKLIKDLKDEATIEYR